MRQVRGSAGRFSRDVHLPRRGWLHADRHLSDRIKVDRPSAAELAWFVLEVLRAGELALSLGWCLGRLRPTDLAVRNGFLVRATSTSRLYRVLAWIRASTHSRTGHDPWCEAFGISRAHLVELMRSVKATDGSGILVEIIDAAWDELCDSDSPPSATPRELCDYQVREVITPVQWIAPHSSGVRRLGDVITTGDRAGDGQDAAHSRGNARHREVA